MEPERFAERMLEIENLTDELEDAEAQRLLDWGLAELGPLVGEIQDAEAAGEKANALMAVMRKINRLVGRLADKTPEDLIEDINSLDELYAAVFPSIILPSADEVALTAASLVEMTAPAALELIFQRHPQHKSTDTPPPAKQE